MNTVPDCERPDDLTTLRRLARTHPGWRHTLPSANETGHK